MTEQIKECFFCKTQNTVSEGVLNCKNAAANFLIIVTTQTVKNIVKLFPMIV